jgi:hypothetical protein
LEEGENYAFSHWEGGLTGNENPADIIMNANKSVTAHFEELDYNLAIEVEGNGTVARRIVSGGEGAGPVQIELTAHPSPGWVFAEWTGDLSGRPTPAILVLDGDKTITAHFTDDHSEITGTIIFGRSGSGVAGATVTIVKSEDGAEIDSTETDSKGRYSFLVEPGIELDLIATKEGFAGSRFQGIVFTAGENFQANLIMQEPRVPNNWDTTPPSLRITGVTSGQTISGTQQISVGLSGDNEPMELYIDIGAETNRYPYKFTGGSINIPLDTSWYPDGPSFIYIAVYDLNENCVITRIPVTIKNGGSPGSPLTMKKRLMVGAYTYGDDMHTSSVAGFGSFDLYRREKNLPPVRKDISTMAAEEKSACYVYLRWDKEFSANSGFRGYNVYRSPFANGPWQWLGTAHEYVDYDYNGNIVEEGYCFSDTTPDVTPGVRFYYKVVPFSHGGVEGNGQIQWVVPVGRFEVNLKAPAHEERDVPLNPTLEWEHNGLMADYYLYGVELISLNEEPGPYAWTAVMNETSVVYDNTWDGYFDLQSDWRYEWDVYYAEAGKIYDYEKIGNDYVVYSIAISIGQKGRYSGSYNGSFVFTTGDVK